MKCKNITPNFRSWVFLFQVGVCIMKKKGLVHIYTGDGKGKTTAAVGLAVRAFGSGLRVLFAQFLKGRESGEIKILRELEPGFRVCRSGFAGKFTWQMDESEFSEAKKEQNSFLDVVIAEAFSGKWDMLILDEILVAVNVGIIDKCRVERLVKEKPEDLELVMTGRSAPESLIQMAAYVSEIRAVKHPYEKGIGARKGIEE
jgi:cob(I)alamin adenosyltransferase